MYQSTHVKTKQSNRCRCCDVRHARGCACVLHSIRRMIIKALTRVWSHAVWSLCLWRSAECRRLLKVFSLTICSSSSALCLWTTWTHRCQYESLLMWSWIPTPLLTYLNSKLGGFLYTPYKWAELSLSPLCCHFAHLSLFSISFISILNCIAERIGSLIPRPWNF